MKSKIIAIVGSTASGKSSLGIDIAKRFNGEVISVDSRQVYRGMDIGTAKVEGGRGLEVGIASMVYPNEYIEVDGVWHWGVDIVEPDVEFSVANFKAYADRKIEEILKRGHLPILVGGTGFWLQAIVDNFDLAKTKGDATLRAELEQKSVGELFHAYKNLDPEGTETIDRDNKRKLVRALEVTTLTGKPFSQAYAKGEPRYDVLEIGLHVDRDELIERINLRVDTMVARGLVDEVRRLQEKHGCEIESMTGIGYRQICDFLEKRTSLKEAVEAVKIATRQYAKRQMTWFKRDARIRWIDANGKAIDIVDRFLAKH